MRAVAAYVGTTPVPQLYLGTAAALPPQVTVVAGSAYHGPVELTAEARAGSVLLLHQAWDWGARTDMVAPDGSSDEWSLLVENSVATNGPMIQVYAGVAADAGAQEITAAGTSADAWVHAHLYVLPPGTQLVDADTADGATSGAATAPAVIGAAGDILIATVATSYHSGAVDFTADDSLTLTHTAPTGQYGTLTTGWGRTDVGEPGPQAFTPSLGLTEWATTTVLARSAVAAAAGPVSTQPMQPAALVYQNDPGPNVASYEHPGALIVTGRDNYDDPAFAAATAAGAHVLVYVDAIVRNTVGRYHDLLHNTSAHGAATIAWAGLPDANETGPLVDIRPGTFPLAKLEAVLEVLVDENPTIAGLFADDLGSRSYFPGIDWDAMSVADQAAYRSGAIQIGRVFRAVANRHGLLLIVNGTWNGGAPAALGGGFPVADRIGCSFADGGVMENWDGFDPTYRANYVNGAQWGTGSGRLRGRQLMFAITADVDDRDEWAASGGVAWCAYQGDYGDAEPPWAGFHPIL